jgi:hypothetical protein
MAKKKPCFDGVLGNPPFIRYQFLEKYFQKQTELVFKQPISDGITIPILPPSFSNANEDNRKGTQAFVCLVNFKSNCLKTSSVCF